MTALIATYRLQFTPSFRFSHARALLQYLAKLGISHIYASPIFRAKKGSTHGYDVVDPGQINPELGTAEEFEELVEEAKKQGIGWIQDIVPNHSGYCDENPMLADLMMRGERSEYFSFFDIEWNRPEDCRTNPVLAPFLTEHYSKALENGDLGLEFSEAGLQVRYGDIRLPLRLESYAQVLGMGLDEAASEQGSEQGSDPKISEFLTALKFITKTSSGAEAREIIRLLFELCSGCLELQRLVGRSLERFKGRKGDPESFDLLDQIMSRQVFKLGFWRSATEEINYRRFFAINDLISVRVEDPEVFEKVHALAFDLLERGKIDGLRVDHIDGLRDPEKYLKDLRSRIGDRYLVVEKILSKGESLPRSWPVQGTTGYDFLNQANGIFCDVLGEKELQRIYENFTRQKTSFQDIVYNSKKLIIDRQMNGDLDNLAKSLEEIAKRSRQGRDMTLRSLRRAIAEVISCFPVYRTYITSRGFRHEDRLYIEEAASKAAEKNSDLIEEIGLLKRALILSPVESQEGCSSVTSFAMRFQQFTGPIMAKGFEDTALYVYNRLISQNSIGASPKSFGTTLGEFHQANQERRELWPHTMNATSTHDTKRGEDSNARINVLSEMPEEWEMALKRWSRLSESLKKIANNGFKVPDRNEEYFLYQVILGSLPFQEGQNSFSQRIEEYLIKFLREAKVHSRWSEPDASYEQAFISFVRDILRPGEDNPLLADILRFWDMVLEHGIQNSLSQTLIKMTSPGVPDFYQGTELWDLSFVDPDNRRQVDFQKRMVALEEIAKREEDDLQGLAADMLAARADGRVKLFLIHRILQARRLYPRVFSEGSYLPLQAEGIMGNHIIAYARVLEGRWAVTIAPRLAAKLGPKIPLGKNAWGDARILMPDNFPKHWRQAVTSKKIESPDGILLCDVLEEFPVALLLGGEGR